MLNALRRSEADVCPNTASLVSTLTNLANLLSDERNCLAAKKLYLEALEIDTKIYGANHQEVASPPGSARSSQPATVTIRHTINQLPNCILLSTTEMADFELIDALGSSLWLVQ